jgi:hypothetical protein
VALDPWEAWLRLRARWGRRATLVDLYEPEAAFQGIGLEQLTAADRERLKVLSRHVRRDQVEVVPGSGRSGDPHEVNGYDPAWPGCFGVWHRRGRFPPSRRRSKRQASHWTHTAERPALQAPGATQYGHSLLALHHRAGPIARSCQAGVSAASANRRTRPACKPANFSHVRADCTKPLD